MAKFIEGTSLNHEITRVFKEAKEELLLVSPYIKLHHRYKDVLRDKLEDTNLAITVVFGKNEGDLSKSLNISDLEFFINFPNIKICYEPRLHAKYYSNESIAVLTSMNLYDFSQDQNIEAGVLIEYSRFGVMGANSLDQASNEYFTNVANKGIVIFEKIPHYESKFGGLQKKYLGSEVTVNIIEERFNVYLKEEITEEVPQPSNSGSKQTSQPKTKQTTGYCIRTGVEIPFNPERPMSYEAYKKWALYEDENYPEKYCHFSGELSNKETSFSKPILRKNWKAAKAIFEF